MTIFLIYLTIAIVLGKLFFIANKNILKKLNYDTTYADPSDAIILGLLWPVTLPGLLGFAILTGMTNLIRKCFYKP